MCLNNGEFGFSDKQMKALAWWKSNDHGYDGIICDGAVRSGKTYAVGIGFFVWAMCCFNGESFAVCGRTITSARRNIVDTVTPPLKSYGMSFDEKLSKNYIDVGFAGHRNRFYIFGGKDESSAALIQGVTLAGIFLDEVVLMPRSFVEQAAARCSVRNSKMWFSCNPDGPHHWFYNEWIKKRGEKRLLYLRFRMSDNPSLNDKVIKRYRRLYTGTFYDRFILGKWTAASGAVYPMFGKRHIFTSPPPCTKFAVSADYGTVNPASFGLWGFFSGKWYRLKEYYYSSKITGILRTDEEHYAELEKLCDGYSVSEIAVDPSAASFIECIKRHGKFTVRPADNNVLNGIRRVGDALAQEKILISESCTDTIREFSLYVWDDKSGTDCPLKENDHAMDDIRYFVNTIMKQPDNNGFFVTSLSR